MFIVFLTYVIIGTTVPRCIYKLVCVGVVSTLSFLPKRHFQDEEKTRGATKAEESGLGISGAELAASETAPAGQSQAAFLSQDPTGRQQSQRIHQGRFGVCGNDDKLITI